jgi:hypothetical protein
MFLPEKIPEKNPKKICNMQQKKSKILLRNIVVVV